MCAMRTVLISCDRKLFSTAQLLIRPISKGHDMFSAAPGARLLVLLVSFLQQSGSALVK